MDIALDNLQASEFALHLPENAARGARDLKLGDVVNLRGALHTEPGLVRLTDACVDRGRIDGISWPLGATHLETSGPTQISDLVVNAEFGTHTTGTAGAAELTASGLKVTTNGFNLTTDLAATSVALQADVGETQTKAETARGDNLQLQVGELLVRGAASFLGLRVETGGALTIVASKAEAPILSAIHPRAEISAAGVELDKGIAFRGGEMRIDELHLGAVKILLPIEPPVQGPDIPRTPVRLEDDVICRGDVRLFDLRDLDGAAGHAEIAVFVEAQLPVVGKYKLDRTFKIPIENGAIDFIDVERQLGTIEDAFIDFAVRDGELVIKRDIPLLPTKGKKLVRWPLSAVEQGLAKERKVSLRTLTRYELVKAKEGDSKASVKQVKVELKALSLASPAGAAEDTSKDTSDAQVQLKSFEPISMVGGLSLSDGSRELDVDVRGSGIGLRLGPIPIGERLLGVDSIQLGDVSIEIPEWDGFRPKAIEFELKDVHISGLTVRANR